MEITGHELRQMYHDNSMTMQEIAESLGVPYSTLYTWMRKHGIESRTRSKSQLGNSIKLSEDELRLMYCEQGMTMLQIANNIGVTKTTIGKWIKEYGIKPRAHYESKLFGIRMPDKSELKKMYLANGMTTTEIAESIGVSCSTIRKLMNQYKIELQTVSESLAGKYIGKNNWMWRGGTSFEPYCSKFNDKFRKSVRERDGYTCQMCGYKQKTGDRNLSVHHIHYKKSDCWPDVVALCNSCHNRVNVNRDYWEQYFENQLSERGFTCWSISRET